MKLVSPTQMREIDRRTIEDIGLGGAVLMERAALGAVAAMVAHFDLRAGQRVGLMCGGGNNGGDGYAMARMLEHNGFEVVVVALSDPAALMGDARTNLTIARALGLTMIEQDSLAFDELPACNVWVDAILGTGIDRPISGRFLEAIGYLNEQSAPVFALDIPSGLDGLSGQIHGHCVRAAATASFGFAKVGLVLAGAKGYVGKLFVIDIGLPAAVVDAVGYLAVHLTPSWVTSQLTPRPADFHKGAAGKVLVLAGSREQAGAALMAARGALVAGAGLLTVGTVDELVALVAPALPEAMAAPLLCSTRDANSEERLYSFLERVDTVAIGPGMGTHDGARAALDIVLASDVARAVFDADALNIVAARGDHDKLRAFSARCALVLTPHPGEMARLCATTIDAVSADPIGFAQQLARRTGAVVVLKTATSVVAAPDGRLAINASGNPGMATGGMGDALTGMIAALMVPSTDAFVAACIGVWTHGAAGDAALASCGQRALSVSRLLDHVGGVWREVEP
ncbi:MAG: NAD(P)H-hydrate dehydratase [Bradymonadaceae bacterium]|nr:NAD(P)H-hydrate dehydratase [Lujinxingiaceae bacterium]